MAKFITYHVPSAPAYAAIGRVAVRHGHLDHVLRLLIKTLSGMTIDRAIYATARLGSARLREISKDLSKDLFYKPGHRTTHLNICALLRRAEELSTKRNAFVHGIAAREMNTDALGHDEMNGPELLLDEYFAPNEFPTVDQLDDVANKINTLVNEINDARLYGFIALAVKNASGPAAATSPAKLKSAAKHGK